MTDDMGNLKFVKSTWQGIIWAVDKAIVFATGPSLRDLILFSLGTLGVSSGDYSEDDSSEVVSSDNVLAGERVMGKFVLWNREIQQHKSMYLFNMQIVLLTQHRK